MKHSLQLKLSQHLTLTPQLQQSIRLLQLSTVELNQELERYLRRTRCSSGDADDEPAPPQSEASSAATARRRQAPERTAATRDENARHVADGAPTTATSPTMAAAAAATATGAARRRRRRRLHRSRSPTSHAARAPARSSSRSPGLPRATGARRRADRRARRGRLPHARRSRSSPRCLPEELEHRDRGAAAIALRYVQNFEPTGVGARDCAECLALQLRALPRGDAATARRRSRSSREHLTLLAARDFTKLKRLLRRRRRRAARRARARSARSIPSPGAAFGDGDVRYVVPDVVVRKVRGALDRGAQRAAMPRCASTRSTPTSCRRSRENGGQQLAGAAAGGAVADQERAAALRHDPARDAGDRRPAAELLRARRGRDAPAGAARDRRERGPARIDHLARDDAEVHAHAARHLRAQVFLRQPRRDRHRRRRVRRPRSAR